MKQLLFFLLCSCFAFSQSKIISYALENSGKFEGNIERVDSFPSKYIVSRTVDVWLPKSYSKTKKYNVLYMNDGQMLFDASTTWNKQEWKVDEVASQLMQEDKVKDFIVVAIWNIPNLRHMDLYPKKPYESLSNELKEKIQVEAKKSQFSFDDSKINSDNYLKVYCGRIETLH
jgi:hypothetical protein